MLALRRHLFGIFLAHGAAQDIGIAHGITGEHLRGLHDLLLIDDDAVGVFENRFEQRMQIFDFFLAVFALDIVFGHAAIERAGPVQRQDGDQILKAIGPDACTVISRIPVLSSWNTPVVLPLQSVR